MIHICILKYINIVQYCNRRDVVNNVIFLLLHHHDYRQSGHSSPHVKCKAMKTNTIYNIAYFKNESS